MFRLIKRSKIIKLSLLQKKNNEIYECIYQQLKYALTTNWKWKLEVIETNNIFVNYVDNHQDLIYLKEEFYFILNFKNKKEYINAVNPLLIGFCILCEKLEYFDFKYCIKYRFVDLIETLLRGLGIGTRLLNRIKTDTKKIILPLYIVESANDYWYNYLSFINLNTITSLNKYIKDNGLTRELKWKFLKDVITKKQRKIIKSYSTKYVKNIIECLINKIDLDISYL